MLTALTNEGKLITLLGEMREQVIQLRKHQRFFCPACKEALILKAGHVRIPHFSHRHHSQCKNTTSEPESSKHLKGKQDLFEWCRSNRLDVSLERYLPDIKQRPDLLVEKDGEQFAIEFQCTPISVHAVDKRSKRYLAQGITPIWIVGGLPFHKRRASEMFELTEYHWSLTFRNQENVILAGYEPESGIVSLLSNITLYTPRKVFARLKKMPLPMIKFPLPIVDKLDLPLERWFNEKQKWVQQKVRYGNLVTDPFLKAVYMDGSNPFLLSPLIGLPVVYMEIFLSHSVEWQFFIWTDCLAKLKPHKKISLKYVNYKLRKRIAKGDLVCRVLPLHEENKWEKAVCAYFRLLEDLFYFQKTGKDLYRMVRDLPRPNHIEEVGLQTEEILVKWMEYRC
ncbi:competence protein CoiA [Siminovitchia acidinfaciens]|uniref:competence protein CoiA n=1 Tax=Siminovitchia acidinfaciens TaxID=2321395 RepID=UPI0013E0135D|nr:competence protein CoiA family protein [Siminovitchia acidinfaciens]